MIYLLHGNDYESSYEQLTKIVAKYARHKIIHLDKSTPQEILSQTLNEKSFFPQKEIIILEDLISTWQKLPEEKDIIIWEKRKVPPSEIKKLPKSARVELFSLQTTLYEFLDSIFPGSKKAIRFAKKQNEKSLLWYLQNRLFLLLLVKTGFGANEASNLLHMNLESWQWRKLQDQALRFSISNLLNFYGGALKADFMLKTGRTSLIPTTLVSVLLLKYLK